MKRSKKQLVDLLPVTEDLWSLSPTAQHELAYRTWIDKGKPSIESLTTMLGLPPSLADDIARWKEGTHPCPCQWHMWNIKEFPTDKNFPPQVDTVDNAPTGDIISSPSPQPIDGSIPYPETDIDLINLGISSIKPYLTGARAIMEDGTIINIPRIAPRNISEIVNLVKEFMKLKFTMLGSPTEHIHVTHGTDKPIVELSATEYHIREVKQDAEIDSLLNELSGM